MFDGKPAKLLMIVNVNLHAGSLFVKAGIFLNVAKNESYEA